MRVDAVRNHNVILEVAGDLLCQHGPSVSMDAIATAACVGKGTLFRRFGDRDGLIQAVASERTQVWWQGAQARAADESVPARERALRLVDEMFELFRSMKTQGTTVLLVEQNVELALGIADRAYVLDQGAVVHHASAQALLADDDIKERYCSV